MGERKYDLGEICRAVGEPPSTPSHRDEASLLLEVIASGVAERAPELAFLLRTIGYAHEKDRVQLGTLVRAVGKLKWTPAPTGRAFVWDPNPPTFVPPGPKAIKMLVDEIDEQHWSPATVTQCTHEVAMAVSSNFPVIHVAWRKWIALVQKRLERTGKSDAELIAKDALIAMGASPLDAARAVKDAMR